MFYDLASTSWGTEEIDAMQRVIKIGMFTMGEQVRRFETDFAEKFEVKHALMVSSGSAANLVGVGALFFTKDRPLQRGAHQHPEGPPRPGHQPGFCRLFWRRCAFVDEPASRI